MHQIYKDIYRDDDNKWQFQYLPEQKWNTIGQHLRIEIEELYRQQLSGQQYKCVVSMSIANLYVHLKKNNKLEVLKRIDDIIKMFKMAKKEIKEANFERIRREDLEALLDFFHKEP